MSDWRVSLRQQIEEVEDELRQRANVYPRLVVQGKMKRTIAEYRTARMQGVLNTLQFLEKHRDEFVAFTKQKHGAKNDGTAGGEVASLGA